MAVHTNWFDWFVLGLYLVGVSAFGLYMSRKEETSTDFFLAGRRLPWYAISLSIFSTNISSGSIVGLAGQGYTVGLAVGTLEWHAILVLILLVFVFLPYYQRRSVVTIPEFLEHRYNLATRLLFSAGVLVFDMVISMTFVLYTGALVIEVMFGVPLVWSIAGIALFVGIYTTWGGLSAVVWTDFVQAIVMVVGAVLVTVLGLHAIGGFGVLMMQASEKMHVALPANHPEYPFPATMIGGYFLVSIYYWCHNQTIVQRALGARTEWDARMGTILTCFIKLFLPFIYVLPGIIAFVLFPRLDQPDRAFPMLVNKVVPAGLSGLILSAVVAALMSTASSMTNSWATLFTHDLYHRLIDKRATARRLILVGRIATALLLIVAAVRAPMLRGNESILQFFLNGLAYMSAPIVVIFMVGMFWRRATPAAAVTTVLVAPIVCYITQHIRALTGRGPTQTSIVYWIPIAAATLGLLMVVISLFTRPREAADVQGLIWNAEGALAFGGQLLRRLDAAKADEFASPLSRLSIWRDYRVMAVLAVVLMIVLIWCFR